MRAANSARKNATFASLGESLWTGPGGASKKPAWAGLGGVACRGLNSSIFSRRAFSARSRASSVATAEGIPVTSTPYAARGHATYASKSAEQQPGSRTKLISATDHSRAGLMAYIQGPGLSWMPGALHGQTGAPGRIRTRDPLLIRHI